MTNQKLSHELSRREFLCSAASAAGLIVVGVAGCAGQSAGETLKTASHPDETKSDSSKTASGSKQTASGAQSADWEAGGGSVPVTAKRNADGTLLVRGGGKLKPGTALAFTHPPEVFGLVCAEASGEIYAISSKCTHAGCLVVWQQKGDGGRLHCPCHLSNFDMKGRVLNGPANKPLLRYTVCIEGDDAIVSL